MRDRQQGFDCAIVLFMEELGGCGGVILGSPNHICGSSVDRAPQGTKVSDSTRRSISDVHCVVGYWT